MVLFHPCWSSTSTENRHKPPSSRLSRILLFHSVCCNSHLQMCCGLANDTVLFIQRQLHRTLVSDTKLMWTAPTGVFPWGSAFKLQFPFSFVVDTPRKIAPSARSIQPLILTESTLWKSMAPTELLCVTFTSVRHIRIVTIWKNTNRYPTTLRQNIAF